MTNGNDSAYARPAMRDEKGEKMRDDILSHGAEKGLTKREYFAAMAMNGMLHDSDWDALTLKAMTHEAVAAADKLIEALNKEQP